VAFAKLKSDLRHVAPRLLEDLQTVHMVGLVSFRPAHCGGFSRHARYASIRIETD